jgi:hypothetical protein
LEHGGTLLEHTAFRSAEIYDDGVLLRTLSAQHAELPLTPGDTNRPMACSAAAAAAVAGDAADSGSGPNDSSSTLHGAAESAAAQAGQRHPTLTCRLVLDCMGHYGPIVKQMRGGAKPSGMVVVVGGCHSGVPPEGNTSADLLYSLRDSEDDMQVGGRAGGLWPSLAQFGFAGSRGRADQRSLWDHFAIWAA